MADPDTIKIDIDNREIGNYRIIDILGEGGMGVVYRGEHKLLGRGAAIKVLRPRYSRQQHIVERFFNEAKAAAAIKHPGIVEIYDFGYESDNSAYIAMELLQGEELKARRERMIMLPEPMIMRLGAQIANVLDAAHGNGIVHRDLKPDNIFVIPDPQVEHGERVKILDFGIAKMNRGQEPGPNTTRTGMVMGTPTYMAPEQCRSAAHVDGRADLYSLGCILFEMLCGRPPFRGHTSMDVMTAHVRELPPRPGELKPVVNPDLEALIMRLLAKNPDQRFQRAVDVETALGQLLSPAPIRPAQDQPSAPVHHGHGQRVADLHQVQGAAPLAHRTAHAGAGTRRVVPIATACMAAVLAGIALVLWSAGEPATPAPSTAKARPSKPAEPAPPALVFGDNAPMPAGDTVTWQLRTEPQGAQVIYNNELRGVTPLMVRAPRDTARSATLRLRLDGHVDRDIEISTGQDFDQVVELVPYVKIAFFSTPEGAEIRVKDSDERVGMTPGEVGVPPGNEPVIFVLRKTGYADEIVEVTPDHAREYNIKLTPTDDPADRDHTNQEKGP